MCLPPDVEKRGSIFIYIPGGWKNSQMSCQAQFDSSNVQLAIGNFTFTH
ncbi:hypothetical protein T01_10192 [Trichinella spiralis]|uniref:Uncharacterized protein n=1 Tax=Trichinella spiralis TaxID=6334 RepID=A0A0V1AZX3_TRISP|nr:hypothetical protein T01_10192 [Trichinella spiralis]